MTDTDAVVRSFYGRWSAIYDRLATLPPASSWRARTAEALRLGPGETVVEMGCGTGANLHHLRQQVGPGGRVLGLDLTAGMLQRARTVGREPGGLVQADATRPQLDGDLDAILGTFVVGLFAEPAAVVAEWCDQVGPGGRVGLLHFHASDRRFAAPVNALYRALVRVSSPSGARAAGAAAHHDARVRQAEDALAARASSCTTKCFAGGFLRLTVGQIGADDTGETNCNE